MTQYLTADHLSIYPEYAEATAKLAGFFDVAADEFMLSNGTDEAIQLLVNTFVDDGRRRADCSSPPTRCTVSTRAGRCVASAKSISRRRSQLSRCDRFSSALSSRHTRAVLIANPNNPTGTRPSARRQIRKILEAAPQAAVLIDEAYFEFFGVTVLPWIREYPNLFVSRTFSKVYGMAAMRCGCLFSCAENIRWLHKAQSPYSVNTLAAMAARAAVEDTRVPWKITSRKCSPPDRMVWDGLDAAGHSLLSEPPRTSSCFMPAIAPFPSATLCASAACWCATAATKFPGCVRVTIGTRAGAERFLAEL